MQNPTQKILAALLLPILILGGCGKKEVVESAPPETFVLQAEDFTPTIELAGNLAPAEEAFVSAKAAGRIDSLDVGVGDRVVAGQILGALAAEESKIGLQTAATDSSRARSSYSAQKALLDQQVVAAEKAVATARAALTASENSASGTKSTTVEQVALAEKGVQQAEDALASVKNVTEQRWESFYSSAQSTVRGALIVAGSLASFAENLLETSNDVSSYYDQYKNYFGAKDSQSLTDARNTFHDFYNQLEAFSKIYESKIKSGDVSQEEWVEYMTELEDKMELAQTLVEDMYHMLSATISGGTLSETTLQSLKSQTLTFAGTVESAILSSSESGAKAGVRGWLMTKSEIETQNSAEISAAEKQVLVAKQALNQAKAATSQGVTGAYGQVNILEEQLAQAEAALVSAKALRESTLRQLERGLSAASGSYQLATALLDNTKITAPFSGIIVAKLADKGEVVGGGQPVFQISNDDLFKLEADVPDTKIAKLQLGLAATVTLDGLGGEFAATLTKIDPAVDPITRKLGVELTLSEIPAGAKVGQFARAKLNLPAETAFFVPRKFVRSDFDGQYILLENGERISVFTGDERDDEIKIWWPEIESGKILEL